MRQRCFLKGITKSRMKTLIDPFNRRIEYVRLSVTDRCNFRCDYCMPEQGYHPEGRHTEYLSYEEMARIMQAFAELGVAKVRLTGGEPLVRKHLDHLAGLLNQIEGIEDIALSTNAFHLAQHAQKLYDNGVRRVNISLDSLIAQKFRDITRGGELDKVLAGIDAAVAVGMQPVKINMVVMKDVNDDEIESMLDWAISKGLQLRFIETMPIGAAGIDIMKHHLKAETILARVKAHLGEELIPRATRHQSGPARTYVIEGSQASIGVISAVSQHFCESCNRVRLTAKGILALCLGQEDSVNLREPLRAGITDEQLKQLIVDAVAKKPERHFFNENVHTVQFRQMVSLGG